MSNAKMEETLRRIMKRGRGEAAEGEREGM